MNKRFTTYFSDFIDKLKKVPSRIFLDGLFAVGIVLCLVLIVALHLRLGGIARTITERMPATASEDAHRSRVARTSELAAPRITSPAPRAMVTSNTVTIRGEAMDNCIVSLLRDTVFIAAALPRDGKFEFANVEVRRGQNRFQVKIIAPDGRIDTIQEISFLSGSPTLAHLSRDYTRGSTSRREIALTFDGDYLNNAADSILNILQSERVRCTFFLTGRFISKYPGTVKRIVSEGHEVGNHTLTHPHLTTFAVDKTHHTREDITRAALHRELKETEKLFERVAGRKMSHLWRAPFGEHNREIRKWAAELGYRQVGWTIGRNGNGSMDTMDWVADKGAASYRSAEEIAEKILSFGGKQPDGANGCIVLMHLGTERVDDFPYTKLRDIIRGLREQGYTLVTVSALLN